jgi:subtilase family serine protease
MAQQANAEGMTWVASAGDSGGAGCVRCPGAE